MLFPRGRCLQPQLCAAILSNQNSHSGFTANHVDRCPVGFVIDRSPTDPDDLRRGVSGSK